VFSTVERFPGSHWLINDEPWKRFRPHEKHGRELCVSPDKKFIIKAERIEDEIPQSWIEAIAWDRFLVNLPPGYYVRFAPVVASGSFRDETDYWAWVIQEYTSGYSGYSQRDMCPPSPYFTFVIAEAREQARSLGLNDRDLTFRGQYVYDAVNNQSVCVDYGRVLK
jgi:hypothetical protein